MNAKNRREYKMNIKQITARHLVKNGYDGLVHIDFDGEEGCGCGLDCLFPCANPHGENCMPAYKYLLDGEEGYTTEKRR